MSLNIKRPTPWVKKHDQSIQMLTPHHYVCLMYGRKIDNPQNKNMYHTDKLYVCDGEIYLDEHNTIDVSEVTEKFPWFWTEYRKVSPEIRRELRLNLPDEEVRNVSDLDPTMVDWARNLDPEIFKKLQAEYEHLQTTKENTYTCDECGEEMTLKQKGLHRAAHARARKAESVSVDSYHLGPIQ